MKIKGWVDRQIPQSYHAGDPDLLRRARVLVLFCAIFFWYIPIPIAQNALLGNWALVAFYATLWLTTLAIPKLLRHSLELAANTLVGLFATATSIFAYTYGGQASSQIVLIATAPMQALMLAGRRSARVWLAISLLIGITTTVLSVRGYTWPRPAGMAFHRFWMMGYLAGAVLVYGFASMYENAKEQMRVGLAQANAEMRLLLDNVAQGFLNVDLQGRVAAARSAIAARWFGEPEANDTLFTWFTRQDAHFGAMLEVAWQQLIDGFLPIECAIDTLPKSLHLAGRTYGFEYQPVLGADGQPSKVVVVITDITAKLEAERAEAIQRELTQVFERIQRDRQGFLQYWDDAVALVAELQKGSEHELRVLHTLKGNSLLFSVRSVAERCHELEAELQESAARATPEQIEKVTSAWQAFTERVRSLIETDNRYLAVSRQDYSELYEAITRRTAHHQLGEMLDAWRNERTETNFNRMSEQAQRLAERLGKRVSIEVQHNEVRLDPQRFAPLWSTLVHAVRNAVDHGLESPDERQAAAKTVPAKIVLSSRLDGEHVVLEIADDGRGIDWRKVREKAITQGLPHETPADLEAAIFSDGISTKDEASEVSGRGVGMGALKQTCESLQGTLTLHSELGRGTRFSLRLPLSAATTRTAAA